MQRLVRAARGKWRLATLLAVAAAALLAIAGCGGGDSTAEGGGSTGGGSDSSSTVAATITKAQLIEKADAICRKTDADQKSAYDSYKTLNPQATQSRAGAVEAVAAAGLPPIEVELAEITALGAPKGDEEEVGKFLDTLERALSAAKKNPAVLVSQIPDPLFGRVEKLGSKYGFKDCAKAL